ncbi:MAG: hypothetical protein QW629_04075, partial [Candidatus Bathyarchaeia archaeon]
MKKKTAIIALIVLLTLTIFSQISPHVNAVDVKITSISPTNRRGKVGDIVNVIGTINTTDGGYQI